MTASNVTRLPTAARLRIDNRRFADQRRAAMAKRKAEPWPGTPASDDQEGQPPQHGVERSPELFALLCVLTAFPADRLDALEAAADTMLAKSPDDAAGRVGHGFVRQAVRCRRRMALAAGEPA